MRLRGAPGLLGSGRAARVRSGQARTSAGLDTAAALRARIGTRARSVVLVDNRGALTGGDLLDLVRLHRAGSGAEGHGELGALPAAAPLRQVVVTVLAGDGTLEPR